METKEEDKLTGIYHRIENYFESNQTYMDVNFNLAQMAHDLNINSSYLSKAINQRKGMNFNAFINTYRIKNAKKLMQSDAKKYTIKYIYLSSGFKNQSSFNKAFKLQEGMTPSEYLNKQRR
jgi:AraC-like DNA-binding protein